MRKIWFLVLILSLYILAWVAALHAEPVPIEHVVVEVHAQPGDTAWGLIKQANPNKDPRLLTPIFKELNGSTDLKVGQRVRLPVLLESLAYQP